jgi:hypothetical protein
MSGSKLVALGAVSVLSCASARTPDVPSEPAAPSAPAESAPAPEPAPQSPPETPDAAAPDAATAASACPAPEHGTHCLWIATAPPNPFRAKHVTARLKKDGFEATADGDRIIVVADDAALEKLFEAKVEHGLSAASSSNRMRCVATLPAGTRLAQRYRGEVGDFVLDDPTCEL